MSTSSSKVTPPVTVIALVVGPMEPATQRGRPSAASASAAASRASSAARRVDLQRLVGEPVLGEDQRRRAERVGLGDVGAGLEVAAVDAADEVRAG